MNSVLAQTSLLAAIALTLLATKSAPAAGMCSGCSQSAVVGMIQDTAGSLSFLASCSNWPAEEVFMPYLYSGEDTGASRYWWKYSSTLRWKLSASWYTFHETPALVSASGYVRQVKPPAGTTFS